MEQFKYGIQLEINITRHVYKGTGGAVQNGLVFHEIQRILCMFMSQGRSNNDDMQIKQLKE